jgi:hypothetical protein
VYGNLGNAYMRLNEYFKAVAYLEAQHALAISLKLAQGPADADQTPGPHSHSSASACLNDRVREAAKWLQAAFDGGRPFAELHLAHLTFYVGQQDAALAHDQRAPLIACATGTCYLRRTLTSATLYFTS